MEGYGRNELKQVENRRNWENSMKQANQGNSIDQIARTGWLDLPEAQRRSAGPWCHGANFRKTDRKFPFSALQTLENLSERILPLLAI